MIDAVMLGELKCFDLLRLRLAPLTLLTGYNAAGKSTSLQALLLLSQTLRSRSTASELKLNGTLVSLGSPGDVLREGSEAKLKLGFTAASTDFVWTFGPRNVLERRFFEAEDLTITTDASKEIFYGDELEGLLPDSRPDYKGIIKQLENLCLLSASRKAIQDTFPPPPDDLRNGDPGCYGEYAPWLLSRLGDGPANPDKALDRADVGSVRKEVNNWLGELFPGAQANAVALPETDLIKLQFRTTATGTWKRPANVGYGLSYALPMLVSGICADAGQMLIVDSPEAHLHPRGQSSMGRFVATMANAGQQLICETHSDHFLNGVRRALRDRIIRPEDIVIYFFDTNAPSRVQELNLDAEGNISNWPSGFFDQAEQDLAALAGWA